jgi:hypothetical protein
VRQFADAHDISSTTLQRHITSIRNGMVPNSAEARALKSDQQLHYRRAFEQRKVDKQTASHQKRLATRLRKAEEKTHYHQGGKSVGATWPVFRAAVGYAVDLRRNNSNVSYTEAIAQTKIKYPDIKGIDRHVILRADAYPDGYPRRVGRQPFMEDKDVLLAFGPLALKKISEDIAQSETVHEQTASGGCECSDRL